MIVSDLVEILQKLPQDLIVTHVDGENGRTPLDRVAVERDYVWPELKIVELS